MDSSLFDSMTWRSIGPHRGGRVVAVSGDVTNRNTFYFGASGGGVWKTIDGGLVWRNVSDGYFKYASVGALQVAPSDPNVIYVGMGEANIRGNVSRGDGVYKSTDAGRTWHHIGLAETQNIGEIVIHPENPDLVYVAAFGHVWGSNAERGVYRSTNGGESWDLVLFKSDKAGAVDLSMDPNNPRTIYATIWEAFRSPYSLSSGGADSGLWRTFDGGETWEEISRNAGLPGAGILGKIGVVVSGAQQGRVYAIVEHENGALFRSDDYGETWQRGSEERSLRTRAWYYHHIYADPQNPDTVWVLNNELWRSIDAGMTVSRVTGPHVDNHALWIDPVDSKRMILGNDGGACVSFTGGPPWSTIYNQPTGEFYHVVTDSNTPYRVYGAQQDNTTMSVPSRSDFGAITTSEWREIGGGESGYIAVRPDNPNIVYAGMMSGYLTQFDAKTGFVRNITVWPEMRSGSGAIDHKYRWQWTSPIMISPHDSDTLYSAGNHLFRTTDEGQSWEVASPDLTVGDPETLQPSGGPITKDNTGAETYGTIFAVAESPLEAGVLWAGSDDGLVQISRDNGTSWTNVNPPGLPDWSLISIIDASPHRAGKAYVAATRYKSHDDKPYLYRTDDYGESWNLIVDGIPEWDFTRVVREDPEREGLLYAGTETGIYVSFDDGGNWQSLQLNLPIVPIHDLVVTGDDLVAATHGRSFWVLDDISPLRQLMDVQRDKDAHLFQSGATFRWVTGPRFATVTPEPGINYHHAGGLVATYEYSTGHEGLPELHYLDAGDNPPDGVPIRYYLKNDSDEVLLSILDADGQEIRSFSSAAQEGSSAPVLPANCGSNSIIWDLRYPGATPIHNDTAAGGAVCSPKAVPGDYTAQLLANDLIEAQPISVLADPRSSTSQEEYEEQFALQIQIRDKLSQVHEGVNTIRSLRDQIESWGPRIEDEGLLDTIKTLNAQLLSIEGELIQYRAKARQDMINFPAKLNVKLASLHTVVETLEGRPTKQAYELFDDLAKRVDEQLEQLTAIIEEDVASLNSAIKGMNLPPIWISDGISC